MTTLPQQSFSRVAAGSIGIGELHRAEKQDFISICYTASPIAVTGHCVCFFEFKSKGQSWKAKHLEYMYFQVGRRQLPANAPRNSVYANRVCPTVCDHWQVCKSVTRDICSLGPRVTYHAPYLLWPLGLQVGLPHLPYNNRNKGKKELQCTSKAYSLHRNALFAFSLPR